MTLPTYLPTTLLQSLQTKQQILSSQQYLILNTLFYILLEDGDGCSCGFQDPNCWNISQTRWEIEFEMLLAKSI